MWPMVFLGMPAGAGRSDNAMYQRKEVRKGRSLGSTKDEVRGVCSRCSVQSELEMRLGVLFGGAEGKVKVCS